MAVRKRKGRAAAEKTVIALEAIKAVLRLGLMGATKGRTGVQPPVAEREMDPAVVEMNREKVARLQRVAVSQPTTSATSLPPPRSAADVLLRRAEGASDLEVGVLQAETEEKEFWTGTRTGVVRPTLASLRKEGGAETPSGETMPWASAGVKDAGKEYLMNRVLTIEDVKRPEDLVSKARGVKKIAEIIYILRPLIYGTFPFSLSPPLLFAELYSFPHRSPRPPPLRPPPHPPVPPLPLPRIPRLLPPPIDRRSARRQQSERTDASSLAERIGEAGDGEEGEAVLVVPHARTGVGELDKVRPFPPTSFLLPFPFLSSLSYQELRNGLVDYLQASARIHRSQVRRQASDRVRFDHHHRLHALVRRVLLLCVSSSLPSFLPSSLSQLLSPADFLLTTADST